MRATEGEPEAVNEVLQYYSRRIRYAAIENGHGGQYKFTPCKLTKDTLKVVFQKP